MAPRTRTNRNLVAMFLVDGESLPFQAKVREDSVPSFERALNAALDHFAAEFFPLPEGSAAKAPWKRAEPVWSSNDAASRELVGWRLADGRLLTHEMFRQVAGMLTPA